MAALRALALEHRPKLLLCGHSSYPREIDYAAFQGIASEVGALSMADVSHIGGLTPAGALRNPLDDGFDVMTTTHKTLRGPRGGLILCRERYAKAIDQSVFPGLQGGPHMQSVAGIAIALKKAATPAFTDYCQQVLRNARALAGALSARGARLITGGTENHLLVVDVAHSYALSGAEAQLRLESAGIVTNKQVIPDDPAPPMKASGIRVGTPAATARGMKEADMERIAGWMDQVLRTGDSSAWARIANQVQLFCARYPVPSLEL